MIVRSREGISHVPVFHKRSSSFPGAKQKVSKAGLCVKDDEANPDQ